MVDQTRVEQGVLDPLATLPKRRTDIGHLESALHTVHVQRVKTRQELNVAVSDGKVVLCIDGSKEALTLDVSQPPGRPIEKAEIEPTILRSAGGVCREPGTEYCTASQADPQSALQGRIDAHWCVSKTNVCILYIEGIVKPDLVEEAHQRLRKISIDSVNDINKLRELISDAPYTVFPTSEETERPDRVVAGLLQGRVAIMLDGAPDCLMSLHCLSIS